ncbi:MAG TPA: monofunctional biosynthetic peptidoglycan transglycosylase [Flavobacteriaceae bacterium]|nr:monofunctional biosynthetic peptidoglycan transglycosylase [Flavobacteriaceae bacterium]
MRNKIAKWGLKITMWFFALSIGSVILLRWIPVWITPLMLIRSVEQKRENKEMVWQHQWVSLDKISKNLQLAVICSEDQNFLQHKGFDFKAIEKALEDNKKSKRIKGASTISQQTAKNAFLWPHRSWLRKGLESYFTFLIEIFWTKERIMEVYLNSIEMGDGIYGAEAASRYWFKKPAAKLSQDEAAAIAAILPNPLRYKATPPTTYIQIRKRWILVQMKYFGRLEYKQ